MPRLPRLQIADGVYHVTNRGLERRNIVHDDEDRRQWYRLFDRVARRCGWRVFAWTLLNNHFHVFVRTPQPNLSGGMHDLQSGYVSLFNPRHQRNGPLFQGRFHAVLVEAESHAAELSRYVHLNCSRAGLANDPGRYRWSSYRHYLDPRGAPDWLDWQSILAEFARVESRARIAYRRFIEAGLASPPPNPLEAVVDGWLLGSLGFVEHWRRTVGADSGPIASVEDIVSSVADQFSVTEVDIRERGRHRNRARDAAILLTREWRRDDLTEIARYYGGVSRSAITEAVRRARQRESEEAEFRAALDALRAELL